MNYSYREQKEITLDLNTKKIIGTDLVEWFGTKKTVINGNETIDVSCGITSKDVIEAHTAPEFPKNQIHSPIMYNNYAYVMKLSKEKYEKILSGDLFVYDDNVFEYVNEKNIESSDYITVLWNPGSHKLCDMYHNFISIPIRINYASSLLTNEYYDLSVVLKELKKSPYVLKADEIKIENIPSYNVDEDGTQYIDFLCLLDNETYVSLQGYDSFMVTRKIVNDIVLCGKGKK